MRLYAIAYIVKICQISDSTNLHSRTSYGLCCWFKSSLQISSFCCNQCEFATIPSNEHRYNQLPIFIHHKSFTDSLWLMCRNFPKLSFSFANFRHFTDSIWCKFDSLSAKAIWKMTLCNVYNKWIPILVNMLRGQWAMVVECRDGRGGKRDWVMEHTSKNIPYYTRMYKWALNNVVICCVLRSVKH